MGHSTYNPADTALAAWQAAGIKGKLLGRYKLRWNTWQAWCDSKGIDPLGATHDEYILFVSEHDQNPRMREMQASVFYQPYRHVNKLSPIHPPPNPNDRTIANYIPKLEQFKAWCKVNDTTSLPAQPQDVVSFLTELATTHPRAI